VSDSPDDLSANDNALPSEVGDPEVEALLDFEPVLRKRVVEGAWTPELQREFIARLAVTGSPGRATEEMGKDETGVRKLSRSPGAASFRAAWDGAVDLATRRAAERRGTEEAVIPGSRLPSLDNRRKYPHPGLLPHAGEGAASPRGEGQVLNEFGEWEDRASLHRRADEARDSVSNKLLRARRLYLQEISDSPGMRAAFEILTELPVDWDKAERLEPQPDEPWAHPNMRKPDMLLTAENGWLGDMAHGPDKIAELRQAIDEHRAEEGLPPVDWSGQRSEPRAEGCVEEEEEEEEE
jgi:hypothetical protein